MRIKLDLDENRQIIIINALYTAKQKYQKCAISMRNMKGEAWERVAQQFDKQIKEVSELIEELE